MSTNLTVSIAVSKIGKYATSESGDTVEQAERPHGGISIVVVDGQRSGRSAKVVSNLVARKAISLLAEGVRDGAVARAAHDYLRTHRHGKVSAELSIVSIDLVTQSLVISRNSHCPVLLRRQSRLDWLQDTSEAVGIHRSTKPVITEIPLHFETTVIVFTDGVWSAGTRGDGSLDLEGLVLQVDPEDALPAQDLADAILDKALILENGRPRDDATVLVVKVGGQEQPSEIRRMSLSLPIRILTPRL
jgi:serine phosphatase RsbU (regulator of sigma subunit)